MPVQPPDIYPDSAFDWSPPHSDDGIVAAGLVRDNANFAAVTFYPAVHNQLINTYYALRGIYV